MDEDLINDAELGDEARKFIESSLGKAMLDKADEALKAAQEALEVVDPEDPKAIRLLQQKAQTARNFGEWLREIFDKGENALVIWKERNAES